LRSEVAVSE